MTGRGVAALVLLAPLAGAPASAAVAQSPMDKAVQKAEEPPARAPSDDALAPPRAGGAGPTAPLAAAPQDLVLRDPAARQQYLAAMQRYYQYFADGYAYRSRVFEWQLFSSRVIFTVVLLLVAAGMSFAAIQFRVAMTAARQRGTVEAAKAGEAARAAAEEALTTRLELSAKGIVVNSSVLGVVILAVSLAFFYLYLVYVYPIVNVF